MNALPMTVPMNDLRRAAVREQAELTRIVNEVVASGWYVLGPNTEQFESEFAAYLGAAQAVGVANGTDALQLALSAVGCRPGDVVLTVANAGGYTTAACRALGLVPRYVDIDPDTLQIATASAEAGLEGAAALVITHLYGAVTPDLESLCATARQAGIRVVEDCAQAVGATHAGRRVGTFGDAAAVSFYPTKNLGALGDGGAVVTGDQAIADAVRSLRQYGWGERYVVNRPDGRNSRLDEVQAAVLRHRLTLLDGLNERRRLIYGRYVEAAGPGLTFPTVDVAGSAAHLAVARSGARQEFRERLRALGIATDVHYPVPDHRQPTAEPGVALPETEAAVEQIVSLPLFPDLSDDEVARVCAALS